VRVELYLARGAEHPRVQVACFGTVVADDIAELSALGLAERPWVGAELVGLLDFASFSVPPGTRRGVAPDRAAVAFVQTLDDVLRPLVVAELERLEGERRAAVDRDVVRELQRALRGLGRRLPQYDLPKVAGGKEAGTGSGDGAGGGAAIPDGNETPGPAPEPLELFAPGPLASVRIVPENIGVAPGGERRVRAVAADATQRTIHDAVFVWHLQGDPAIVARGDGARPALVADAGAQLGATATLEVEATDPRAPNARAGAQASVTIRPATGGGELGVPEPNLVSDPDGRWRSRMLGDRWEVNDAHPDYLALRGEPRARVRYLLGLLAKELVIRTTGRADAAELLESLIEVLAHAERNLRGS
jgi:hypothetical protein